MESGEGIEAMSPDEKQWHIECSTLETDRINAEAALVKAQVELVQAEANRMDAERHLLDAKERCGGADNKATLKVSCGHCNAEFEYTGSNEEQMTIMHDRFVDEHGYCR